MKSFQFFPLCLLLLGLSSCGGETTFETKDIDGEFTVDIPSYLVELDLGHPEASFQFGNMEKEIYVVGLREPNKNFERVDLDSDLEDYADFNIFLLKEVLEDVQIKAGDVQQLNGMKSKSYDVRGVLLENGLEIYYNILFYQSAVALYYISSWTLAEQEDTYGADMNRITNSLKEQ